MEKKYKMESVAVCLYSKYSQRSKEFLDDIHPSMGVQMLCVDNEEVRQAIVKDNHGYHIKTVPCIFLFYSNGRLEKYEGSDAFTWLRKTREMLEATMFQPQQTPVQFQKPAPPQQTPIQQITPPQQTPIQQPVFAEQTLMEVPQPFATPYEQMKNEPLDITPIDENGIQSIQQNLPPQQNTEDIMNQEMELRRASDQIMTRKQDNIKELAQMMQRQRENDDDKIAPPALYPKDQQTNRPPF
jgi:hypothetical protein